MHLYNPYFQTLCLLLALQILGVLLTTYYQIQSILLSVLPDPGSLTLLITRLRISYFPYYQTRGLLLFSPPDPGSFTFLNYQPLDLLLSLQPDPGPGLSLHFLPDPWHFPFITTRLRFSLISFLPYTEVFCLTLQRDPGYCTFLTSRRWASYLLYYQT